MFPKNLQGSFQCTECNKTFIYAKSFERHEQICGTYYNQSEPIAGIQSTKKLQCLITTSNFELLKRTDEATFAPEVLDLDLKTIHCLEEPEKDEPELPELPETRTKSRQKRRRQKEKLDNNGGDPDEEAKPSILFKFVHYEELEREFFCRFPGCGYGDSFKTLGMHFLSLFYLQICYNEMEERKTLWCNERKLKFLNLCRKR